MKKLLCCVLFCLLILTPVLSGCEMFHDSVESTPNIKIKSDMSDMDAFMSEITDYAHTYDKKLFLSNIIVVFYTLSLDDCFVTFYYGSLNIGRMGKLLEIDYDSKTKTISYCNYVTGYSVDDYTSEFDYAAWGLDFSRLLTSVQGEIKGNKIRTWDRIGCKIEENDIIVTVFQNDSDRTEIIIPKWSAVP